MDSGEKTPNGEAHAFDNSFSNGKAPIDFGADDDRARLEAMGYKEVRLLIRIKGMIV